MEGKRKQCMKEGAQEDEQFEMEIDNERRSEVRVAALAKTARKMMIAESAEVIQTKLNGYWVF